MRAFRPSRYAPVEEYEEDYQSDKAANLQVYAKRAELGVPLFDPHPGVGDAAARPSDLSARD